MVNIDGATNVAIKVPQMRNLHERLGFDFNQLRNTSGFGTFHDGTLGSVADFVSIPDFSFNNEQQVADVIALVFSLAGGGFEETIAARNLLPAPPSRDVHAGVGQMRMIRSVTSSAAAEELRAIAAAGVTRVELVARTSNEARARGWLYRPSIDRFRDDLRGEGTTLTDLLQTVTEETPLLMMLVPAGMGARLSIDQDGDGFEDGVELAIGTDPFDPSSFPRRSLFGIY
jgi:hypothetical protein